MSYIESYTGTGNYTWSFDVPMSKFTIINDGAADLTFTVLGETITVMVGEEFYDYFPSFYAVTVTATDDWRATAEGASTEVSTTISQLFLELRYELNDMQKAIYSDYQLINTVNTVLTLINNALSKEPNINLNVSTITLTITDGEATLPSNFHRIISVVDEDEEEADITEFKIFGSKIYSDEYTELTITYKYIFGKITATSEILPVPPYFNEHIKKYMLFLLTGQKTYFELTSMIAQDILSLFTGREYAYYDRTPPFTI